VEQILKKLAYFIFTHSKFIAVIFSLLTIITVMICLNMEINSDIINALPNNNELVSKFKDFIDDYGIQDKVTILIESENGRIEDYVNIIETLSKKLNSSSLIEYVDDTPLKFDNNTIRDNFIYFLDNEGLKHLKERLTPSGIEQQIKINYQNLISPFSMPLDYEIAIKDPLCLSEITLKSLMRNRSDNPFDFSSGYYFTKDHSTAFIFIKPKGNNKDLLFVKKFKSELDSIIDSSLKEAYISAGVKIRFSGGYIISEEIRQVLKSDIANSFILSAILIALLIWYAYKVRLLVLGIIGFTLLSSLSMTLALAYLLFGSLNIVSSIAATVLIGLYVDYSMHLLNRYTNELHIKNNIYSALEINLIETGPPIIISALTTSLSFFSILVTNFEGLYELGVIAGLGVLFCLINNLFLMNSLLILASKKGEDKIMAKKFYRSDLSGFVNLLKTKYRLILLFSLGLVMVCLLGISNLSFDNNLESLGIKNSEAVEVKNLINLKINKRGDPLPIIIKERNQKKLAADFDSLEAILINWKKMGLINDYDSLSFFLPPFSVQLEIFKKVNDLNLNTVELNSIKKNLIASLQKYNISFDIDYINSYLTKILTTVKNDKLIGLERLEDVADPKVAVFYNKDIPSIVSYVYPKGKNWNKDSLKIMIESLKSANRDWTMLGNPILFDEIKSSIIFGSTSATAIAIILNIAVIFLFYRNIKYVLLVMVTVSIGFVLTMGFVGFFNIPFNFINVGAIALIFGFGVDYGIYVMQAYVIDKNRDIGNAIKKTGRNIIMGTATTIAGCGSLVFVRFSGIASIGSFLTIGAVLCAFCALVVLPAWIYLNKNINSNERL